MTRNFGFRIVNVFAESVFGGNPLCVFDDANGLTDDEMQALARQFNLSETTFVLQSAQADARVRIFTPASELPFAGHPALGTAHVVRDLLIREGRNAPDRLTLEFNAGVVPVIVNGDLWSFRAPGSANDAVRPVVQPASLIAGLIGLDVDDLAVDPVWADTGADQLLIAVKNIECVRRAKPDPALLERWPVSRVGRKTAYVFAFEDDARSAVLARYFFAMPGGGIGEDPGTGSACANLGAWLVHVGHTLPARVDVSQGEMIGRPCRLLLQVDDDRAIDVGGRVRQIAAGSVAL